jgi:hypothetical protein
MAQKAKPSILMLADGDAQSELVTLYGASKYLNVGYQTLNAATKARTLIPSCHLDTGEKRQGEKGLPLFTKGELDRWNVARKNRGLTVEKAAQFLADTDPAQARELLERYLAQSQTT